MQTTPHTAPTITGTTVGQAMRPGIVSCRPDDELATVAFDLVSNGFHAVVIAPLDHRAPRILTDTDLLRAAVTRSHDVRAIDITKEPAASLTSDAPLSDAVALMAENYTRHLLVTDPSTGAPVGFLSSLDVVSVLGGFARADASETQAPAVSPGRSAVPLAKATVGSVARVGIYTCAADGPLSEVARTMAQRRVHCIAVAGISHPGEHLIWGLIEDIDVIVAAHRGALTDPAVSIAESSPLAVEHGDSLQHAAELMIEHDRSHLVVAGSTGLPVSIVSTLDIAAVLAADAG